MLIKKTHSLCPVCNILLEAEITEEDERIWITRTCPEHGEYRELYWSDAGMYHRFEEFESVSTGVSNPQRTPPLKGCPQDCGLCSNHRSTTLLANIDLTNRCNLNCDFCFANARAFGALYEPSFDQVVGMMRMLREEKPVPTPAVQFSGGEPTLRDDLPDIIRKAKELGFAQVQIATNGIRLAQDPGLIQKLKDAGLSTIYLHFDGVTKETNPQIATCRKVVGNCSQVRMGMVLVPTVIKGRNEHEIGAIIRYAAENIDVVRGVNFQPVAFTGAASDVAQRSERITIPGLAELIEEQTGGVIEKDHFYPVPCVIPISDLVEAYTGKPQVRFSAHQHCGAATYVFVTDGEIVPINDLLDVDGFFDSIRDLAEKFGEGGVINKYKTLLDTIRTVPNTMKTGNSGLSAELWTLLKKALIFHNFDALRGFHWNSLFIGAMHFMDSYNYDTARVQRCCIHYATPDGRIIPFCTYNSGPVYREEVWRKFSRPLDD